MTGQVLLKAADLHKAYGPSTALAGASIEVAAGELVAVMGPSGSGKSTLLHCLAGIVQPDRGSIAYRGQELTGAGDARLSALRRSEFGFLFQFAQLVPELSCLENVALPLRLNGQRRRAAEAAAAQWLERLEVAGLGGQRPGEISGGQAQRVGVARALVTRPKLVFADEPTGALDSLNGERVMELFSRTARETSAAVLLVTHDARVAAYADREVIVRDGRTRDLAAAK